MSGQRAKINNDVYSFKGSTTDAQLLMMDGALGQMASIIGDLIRVSKSLVALPLALVFLVSLRLNTHNIICFAPEATGLPLGYDSIFYFIYLGKNECDMHCSLLRVRISLPYLSLWFSVLCRNHSILGSQVAMVHSDFNEFTAFGC